MNSDDDDAKAPHCRGVIVRDLARRPLELAGHRRPAPFLERHRVPGLAGVDTRRLTRPHPFPRARCPVRSASPIRDVLLASQPAQADGGTDGRDLVAEARQRGGGLHQAADDAEPVRRHRVCDFGIKQSIVDQLVQAGCQVEVVPTSTTASEVLAREPDGDLPLERPWRIPARSNTRATT